MLKEKKNKRVQCSPTGSSFITCITFLELRSRTVSSHSPKPGVDGDLYLNVNKQPHSSSGVVQLCRSLNIPDGFEKMLYNIYTLTLKLKCSQSDGIFSTQSKEFCSDSGGKVFCQGRCLGFWRLRI